MKNYRAYNAEPVEDFKSLLNNSATKYAENIAYKYKKNKETIEIKYKDFKEQVYNLGTALLDMGLENKKIAVISNNRYEWCMTYFAVTTGNMIIVPLDKLLPQSEIESLLQRSGAEAVVFEEKYLEHFKIIKENKKTNLKFFICMDFEKEEDDILSLKKVIEKGKELIEKGNTKYIDTKIDKNKMSALLFTSGTTAQSKGVMLSQHNVCSNISAMACFSKIEETDTLLSFLPLHHTFECTITFLYGFYSGATIAFCEGLKYIAKNMVDYKISILVAVPLVLEGMYKKIQKGIEESGKQKLINTMTKVSNVLLKCKIDVRKKLFKQILNKLGGNLRKVFYGAAPMGKATIIGFNNLGIESVQGYGLTETSPLIAAETDKLHRPGSVGVPADGVEIKIENKNEKGIGEIIAKGPNIMLGYFDNKEATDEVLNDGWFSTGDLGYFDNDGFLFITGRKKDVIVLKNGENIFPQEIEETINKLPFIIESLVYPEEKTGRELTLNAKIVYDAEIMKHTFTDTPKEDYKKVIWEEIKKINQTLSTFKRIKEITITEEPLAKTTTQKVKRFEEINKMKNK